MEVQWCHDVLVETVARSVRDASGRCAGPSQPTRETPHPKEARSPPEWFVHEVGELRPDGESDDFDPAGGGAHSLV